MARHVSTAAILKESIEGRPVEEISIRLKIPVSDVVKAVSDPKFKRDLLDYRLMRGLQQFETIGNLKGYLHAYVKALKEVMEHDPEFFKARIKDKKTEIHKELKGMMDVIRMASDITDREMKKMLLEAEEQEDPSLREARRRLSDKRRKTKQLIELKAQVMQEQGYEPIPEGHDGENHGDTLGPEREDYRAPHDPDAGPAVSREVGPDLGGGSLGPDDAVEPGGHDEAGSEVRSYLLEDV